MVTYGGMSKEPVIVPTSSLIFSDVHVRGFWMTRWYGQNTKEARLAMIEALAGMGCMAIYYSLGTANPEIYVYMHTYPLFSPINCIPAPQAWCGKGSCRIRFPNAALTSLAKRWRQLVVAMPSRSSCSTRVACEIQFYYSVVAHTVRPINSFTLLFWFVMAAAQALAIEHTIGSGARSGEDPSCGRVGRAIESTTYLLSARERCTVRRKTGSKTYLKGVDGYVFHATSMLSSTATLSTEPLVMRASGVSSRDMHAPWRRCTLHA